MGGAMAIAFPALVVGGLATGGYLSYKYYTSDEQIVNEKMTENWGILLNSYYDILTIEIILKS